MRSPRSKGGACRAAGEEVHKATSRATEPAKNKNAWIGACRGAGDCRTNTTGGENTPMGSKARRCKRHQARDQGSSQTRRHPPTPWQLSSELVHDELVLWHGRGMDPARCRWSTDNTHIDARRPGAISRDDPHDTPFTRWRSVAARVASRSQRRLGSGRKHIRFSIKCSLA